MKNIDEKSYKTLRRYKNFCVRKYEREFGEDSINYSPEDRNDARWKYINYKLNNNENYILLREKVHKKRD